MQYSRNIHLFILILELWKNLLFISNLTAASGQEHFSILAFQFIAMSISDWIDF